ncbi:MAG: Hsp20/alpha crystallin family protein [Chloroflexi bacterium]|nr:MAG: Hsp20/alpha crystallin family protein [Chloroflexota bacterium]
MTIARFTPLTDVVSLREAMDRLFEDSFIRPNGQQLAVPVDLWETKDAYHLQADLPGLSADDIEINVTPDTVTISGETKPGTDVTNEGWLRQERLFGKFKRSFTVPMQIDPSKVEAKFTNGVLELVLRKAENHKPRTIKINATANNK